MRDVPASIRRTTTAGRPRLGAGRRRQFRGLYLDPLEEMRIAASASAAGLPLGRFIRRAALGQRVCAIPPVANLDAWRELARLASNLNQISAAINVGRIEVVGAGLSRLLTQIGLEVAGLRAQLIGADNHQVDEGDNETTSTDWTG